MERIMVPFEADGAGTAELTWGQQQVFQAMLEMNSSMIMGGVVPVHDGRTVPDFVDELRFFMTRYPSMRALLRFAPDGTTTQEVFAKGEAYLDVYTAPSAPPGPSSPDVAPPGRSSLDVAPPGPSSPDVAPGPSSPDVAPPGPSPLAVASPARSSPASARPAASSSLAPASSPAASSPVAALPAAALEAAESLAAEVYAGWKARTFDYTTEWPIRMGVVRSGPDGPVTHVLVAVCHIATDVSGLATMIRELGQRDSIGPQPAASPLEIVAQQRTTTRQTDNAMRYWETHLRAVDLQRFPDGFTDPEPPRFRQLVWNSPALHAASERLAALLSIDTAPVLLAAYAVAFTRVVGRAPFVTQVIVSNRFRPGLAEVVTPLAQNGLVVVDVRDATAAEAVLRARQSSMSASKYAYYAPGTRQTLIDRIGKDRGEPVDLQVLYNERRLTLRLPTTPPDQSTIRSLLAETTFIRETPLPYFNEKLMVNIDDVPDTIQITTEVDTAYLPLARLHRLLQEMEHFTVTAALDPTSPALP